VHRHHPGMYQTFLRLSQKIAVPAGKSGDTGGWETGAAAVRFSGMGLKAMRPDNCLPFTMAVNVVSI
jgi:hypothetical protein